MAQSHGIKIKKQFGQHFLRDTRVVESMINAVDITSNTSVFEVGPGDGFLTRAILGTNIARLWSFEIDPDWVVLLDLTLQDERFKIIEADFLDVDFSIFDEHRPWTILANLPYVITFPLLHKFQQHREYIREGVVMVQEEVAQKLTKTYGRGYGFVSLYFQHFFEMRLLDKISPEAFLPAPKVYSRLIYFKPRGELRLIPDEKLFWEFVKFCFAQPRRTLKNNLLATNHDWKTVPEKFLQLRAQQMSIEDLLVLWEILR